jgi:hypothetical protein
MLPVQMSHPFQDCGLFGAVRKHDIHTGVDFYCEEGAEVSCIYDGVVVDVFQFTGIAVGSFWWNTTYAVVVETGNLTLVYGEVTPSVSVGEHLKVGDPIGNVRRVLRVDKGVTPVAMLHLEAWLTDGYQKNYTWPLGQPAPYSLLDPLEVL